MTLDVVLSDPLREPVPASWDGFAGAQRLSSLWHSSLLRTAAWSAQAPTLMSVVSGAGEPLGVFHARLLGPPGSPARFWSPGARPAAVLAECRLQPVGSFPGYALASHLGPRERGAVTGAFERAVRRRLGVRALGVAYRHVTADDLPLLRRPGRVSLRVEPEMIVENRWADLAGYLAALPSRRRQDLRRNRQRMEHDTALQVRVEERLPVPEAARLLEAVRARHRRALVISPPIPVPYLELLSEAADTRFVTYCADGGRLLAFVTVHDDGDELIGGYWGALDPAEGGRRDVYFDALLRLVELMLKQGRRRLRLGKGMAEIKARYGALPSARYAVAGRR